MQANRIFVGFDPRQFIAFTVLVASLIRHAKGAIDIYPLVLEHTPLKRVGLTPFTYSRFLVPRLCGYQGRALFLDIDTMARADINELFAVAEGCYKVWVAKGPIKFEWPSVMLFNCNQCEELTEDKVASADGLHTLSWCTDSDIGDLPREWNHLVGYDPPNEAAKLVHFTQGVPAFEETRDCEFSEEWHDNMRLANSTASWKELMGNSVHAVKIGNMALPKYKVDRLLATAGGIAQ
ncbi:MAG: glycosyltransferase [Nitrososphaerales archaeon]